MPSSFPSIEPSYSAKPSVTTYAVELTLQIDSEASETGWEIYHIASREEKDTLIIERPPGYYAGNNTVTVVEAIRLEAGNYRLQLLDPDGFCCSKGVGYYSLLGNGELLLFREGRFERSHNAI